MKMAHCAFNALQHKRPNGHIQLYAFDILVHRGRNVLRLPIEERRELLSEALREVQYPVIQSVPFDVKPAELLRAAEALQFEGVIAKRKHSIYEPGQRSGAWLKYKINCSQEFVIGGYTLDGNPFDALIVGCYDGPKLKYIAKVRAGFVPHMRCALYLLLQEFRTDKCPFDDLPEKRRTLWRRDAKLPMVKAYGSGANRVQRVDAGRPPAARELCRVAER
jgi:bifunctional non-homologous end joining protein LigD